MATFVFHPIKSIIKRFAVLLFSLAILFSITQTPALAASSRGDVEASTAPGITEPVPGEDIGAMKEQRREWQSQASSSRNDKENKSESLGEAAREKLNLDEIIEGRDSSKNSENNYQRNR